MKHGSDDMPIACGLTSAELRERVATLFAQFRSAVIETEELRDGYAFRVPGDRKWVDDYSGNDCGRKGVLPFLTFEFVAQPSLGPVIARVTGPAGTKGFLKTVWCKADASVPQWSTTRKL